MTPAMRQARLLACRAFRLGGQVLGRRSPVASPLRLSSAPKSSFTVQANDLWRHDLVEITPGVQVRQEATDWEKALPFGLGAVVWESAAAFCRLVEAVALEHGPGTFWQGLSVLELGAGCGAAGLAVAAKGGRVTLSDRPALLPLLERNAAMNQRLGVRVRPLLWSEATAADFVAAGSGGGGGAGPPMEGAPVDVVLATDVVEIDPDRPGEPPFEALRHAFSCMLESAPECLGLIVFEERGHLTMQGLGPLFRTLARDGVLWEFSPPERWGIDGAGRRRSGNRLRYLCLYGQEVPRPDGPVAAWRRLLGEDAFVRRWLETDFDET